MTKEITPVGIWEYFLGLENLEEARAEVLPSLLQIGVRRDLMTLTGENGGGKSLAVKFIGQLAEKLGEEQGLKVEVIDIGMGRRTSSGIVRAMMFGDESKDSTGNISVQTMKTAINTSLGRKGPHILIFDEPDIGLGEGYHSAAGKFIVDFARRKTDVCLGIVVVSHSRKLLAPLIEAGASSLRVGDDLRPVREWLENGDLEKSDEEFLSLSDVTLEKSRKVRNFFGLR